MIFTDEEVIAELIGSEDLSLNEQLSGDRARAVYWLLIACGVDEDRLIPMQGGVTTLYGEDSPLNRMVQVSASKY